MEPFTPFYRFLNKFIPLSEEEFVAQVQPFCSIRKFKKRGIILPSGELEQHFNFVLKGLVLKYFESGKDQLVTQVATEDQLILSQASLLSETPSDYTIEAIEQSSLLSIKADDLEAMFRQNFKMERLGRLMVTHILLISDRWQMLLLKFSARERFLKFVQQNPELMRRVPQKYLASLLNIQPETFSRFKHLIRLSKNDAQEENSA